MLEEVKKKNSVIMVKDVEIDSLKKHVKELKETIEKNDTQNELQELKKQH